MKPILASALLLTLLFAGCLGGDAASDDTATTATQTSTTSTTTATQTSEENQTADNTPPTASLSADNLTGEAPFQVSFSINGTDADGDALSWSLDTDGDGTSDIDGTKVPSAYVFTYDTAGTYNATLTVSDGQAEDSVTLTITATQATAPAGPVPDPIVWSGFAESFKPVDICLSIDMNGDSYLYFSKGISGNWLYKAEGTAGAASGLTTEWWDGDTHISDEGAEGTIPAGADNVAVCASVAGVPTDFTLTLYHPDYVFS